MNPKQKSITLLVILVASFLFQVGLQSFMLTYAINGFYFQEWSSETLMQTVSIEDLQTAPIETLLNIHIQPPGLDVIRAIIVHEFPRPNTQLSLVQYVDYWLYKIWAFLYGILGCILFLWIFEITRAKFFSIVSTIIFLLHPACLLYATILESTLLTSILVLTFYYFLWKIKNKHDLSVYSFIIVILTLFFTRSIFQLPFIFVSSVSLLLVGMPKRYVLLVLFIAGGTASIYMAKQYYQFGTFSTSSFTGMNLNRSVGIMKQDYWNYLESTGYVEKQNSALPRTLTRKVKLTGTPNFNNIEYLKLNQQLEDEFKIYIFSTSPWQLLNSYSENFQMYFGPSSQYVKNVIVDRLPWRNVYDRLFSAPFLYAVIFLFGILWLIEKIRLRDYLSSAGILLPGLFIFAICVIGEKGENARFKFFLEPVLFTFLITRLYHLFINVLPINSSVKG